jgi:hypothetical protein
MRPGCIKPAPSSHFNVLYNMGAAIVSKSRETWQNEEMSRLSSNSTMCSNTSNGRLMSGKVAPDMAGLGQESHLTTRNQVRKMSFVDTVVLVPLRLPCIRSFCIYAAWLAMHAMTRSSRASSQKDSSCSYIDVCYKYRDRGCVGRTMNVRRA